MYLTSVFPHSHRSMCHGGLRRVEEVLKFHWPALDHLYLSVAQQINDIIWRFVQRFACKWPSMSTKNVCRVVVGSRRASKQAIDMMMIGLKGIVGGVCSNTCPARLETWLRRHWNVCKFVISTRCKHDLHSECLIKRMTCEIKYLSGGAGGGGGGGDDGTTRHQSNGQANRLCC